MRVSGSGGGRLLLLALLPALAGVAPREVNGEVVQVMAGGGAQFPGRQRTRVSAAAGGAAELHCAVRHLGDRVVSWVRTSDLQILAHAGVVFTGDARVSATAAAGFASSGDEEMDGLSDESAQASEDSARASDMSLHTLRIEQLRARDGGRYECQVNTEPKMSLMFELVVVDEEAPHIEVGALGARATTVRSAAGGAATLACEARWRPPPRLLRLPPLRLRWLRDGRELEARGGVSVATERDGARAVSRLTLAALSARDAGRYQCEAAARGHAPRALTLTLLVGNDSGGAVGAAEMQRDEAAAAARARARISNSARAPAQMSQLWLHIPLALLAISHLNLALDGAHLAITGQFY